MSNPVPLRAPGSRPSVTALAAEIVAAVDAFRGEFESLRFLAEARYDRSVFPTQGQYDWVAGQVLYALVRSRRPERVVEFSTSSGYSTTFTALALRANGHGVVHSVDLDGTAQAAASAWLERCGVREQVVLHTGDCRDVVPGLVRDGIDLLFIDSLHSFELTDWYLRQVVPQLPGDTLVHIHDVMPPEARVRIHGGPPYEKAPPPPRSPRMHLIKRFVWLLLHGKWPNPFPARPPREILPLERLEVFDAPGPLPAIDGNYFEEAVLIRELVRGAEPDEAVYLHRLADALGIPDPQQYAALDRIGRSDATGSPLEWNDALWCRAEVLQDAMRTTDVVKLRRTLERQYYGR